MAPKCAQSGSCARIFAARLEKSPAICQCVAAFRGHLAAKFVVSKEREGTHEAFRRRPDQSSDRQDRNHMIRFASKPVAAMLSIALATVFAGAAANLAQAQQPPRNGWYKVCTKQEENDICNVQFQSVAGTGQVVTSIQLLEVKGAVNRRIFQITVPSGRLIPPGIKVQVDDKKEATLPFVYCFPQNCMAEVALDDNLVKLLKSGGGLTVTSTNFQNRPNPVKITLEGFTSAFDGPALQQDELQARQQELEAELRRKAEEQRKRLQEEQEKAKTGSN
jgi:invasion protein IalB